MNKHDLIYMAGSHNYHYDNENSIFIRLNIRNEEDFIAEDILSDILTVLEPDISFLRFRKLTKLIQKQKDFYMVDPYDEDYSEQEVQKINVDELYSTLIDMKINPETKVDGFTIENFETMVKKGDLFTVKDGGYMFNPDRDNNNNYQYWIKQNKIWKENLEKIFGKSHGRYWNGDFFRLVQEKMENNKTLNIETLYVFYMNTIRAAYPTVTV